MIQDSTGFGLFHPIHLHGHDFWVVAQDAGTFDPATTNLTTTNPPRRDVATLPGNGVSNLPSPLSVPKFLEPGASLFRPIEHIR